MADTVVASDVALEPAPVVAPKKRPGSPKGRKRLTPEIKAKQLPKKPLALEEKRLLLEYFPELFLGERTYPWQFNCLRELGYRDSRVALKAANGSGKTSKVVASAILWHMMRFPGSVTVCTAGVYRQVVDVLWPVLRQKILGLGGEEMGWRVTENKILYTAPSLEGAPPNEASMCVGFSADKPESAEGWHARGPSANLLYIIDEAKAVSDGIFDAMERCQPTRILEVSSPGGRAGRFFERFNKHDERYALFTVTAYDCPHITREWIDGQIAVYGQRSPVIQSMIFAEFGEDDSVSLILPPSVLQRCLSTPPAKEGNTLYAGVDFAAGGDENVIAIREGNTIKSIIAWREKDTMFAVGRFITEFKRHGLEAQNIYTDAGGMGIPMCDALREAGWDVRRVNNGDAAFNSHQFANRAAEMWTQYARLVETQRVVVPTDETLHRQLTTRRLEHNSKGKLVAEPKERMASRGLGSPDRADAVVLAFCGGGQSLEAYMKVHGRGVSFDDIEVDDVSERPGAFAG